MALIGGSKEAAVASLAASRMIQLPESPTAIADQLLNRVFDPALRRWRAGGARLLARLCAVFV